MSTIGSADFMVRANTRAAVQDFSSFSSKIQRNVYSITGSLSRAGNQLSVGLTAPILALSKQAFDAAINVEQLATQAAAISSPDFNNLAGIAKDAKVFGDAAVSVAADLKFTAQEIAGAQVVLARAGVSSSAILANNAELLQRVAEFANVAAVDIDKAAQIAVTSVGSFGLDVNAANLQKFSDVLAVAANKAPTTIEELSTAISYAGPVAAELGLTVEETAGALDVLAAAGIRGSRAGTSLQRVLLGLVNPAKEGETLMGDLGLRVKENDGSFRSFNDILTDFKAITEDLADAEVAEIAGTLFGQRGGPASLKLIEAAGAEMQGYTDNLYRATGATESLSKALENTTQGRIKQLQSSLEALGITLFQTIVADGLNVFLVRAKEVVNTMAEWDTANLKLAGSLVAGVAALGPLIRLTGFFADNFKPLVRLFATVGPIYAAQVLAPLAAGVGIFSLAVKNSDKLRSSVSDLGDVLRRLFTGGTDTFTPIKTAFDGLLTDLEPITREIGDLLAGALDALTSKLVGGEAGVQEFIINAMAEIPALVEAAAGALIDFAPVAVGAFDSIKEGVVGFAEEIGKDGLADGFDALVSGLESATALLVFSAEIFERLAPAVGMVIDPILDLVGALASVGEGFGPLGVIVDAMILGFGIKMVKAFRLTKASGLGTAKALQNSFLSLNNTIGKTGKTVGVVDGRFKSMRAFGSIKRFNAEVKGMKAIKIADTGAKAFSDAEVRAAAASEGIRRASDAARGFAKSIASIAWPIAALAGIDFIIAELKEGSVIASQMSESLNTELAKVGDIDFAISPENFYDQSTTAVLTKLYETAIAGALTEGQRNALNASKVNVTEFAEDLATNGADAYKRLGEKLFKEGGAELVDGDKIQRALYDVGADAELTNLVISGSLEGDEGLQAYLAALEGVEQKGRSISDIMGAVRIGKDGDAGLMEELLNLDDSNLGVLLGNIQEKTGDAIRARLTRFAVEGSELQREVLADLGLNEIVFATLDDDAARDALIEFEVEFTKRAEAVVKEKERLDAIFDGGINFNLDAETIEASQLVGSLRTINEVMEEGKIAAENYGLAIKNALGITETTVPGVLADIEKNFSDFEDAIGAEDFTGGGSLLGVDFFGDDQANAFAEATDAQRIAYEELNKTISPVALAEQAGNLFAAADDPSEITASAKEFVDSARGAIDAALAEELISPEAAAEIEGQLSDIVRAATNIKEVEFDFENDPDLKAFQTALADNEREAVARLAVNMSEEDKRTVIEFQALIEGKTNNEVLLDLAGIDYSRMSEAEKSMVVGNLQQRDLIINFQSSGLETLSPEMRTLINNGVLNRQVIVDIVTRGNQYIPGGRTGSGPDGLTLPGGATGGVFTTPTPRIIGEAGAELLLPLTRPDRALSLLQSLGVGKDSNGGRATVLNSNDTYNINGVDPAQVAAYIAAKQESKLLRIGAFG